MAHYVDTMFSVGQRPWHGLGNILKDVPNIREGIVASGLDWSVEKRPLQYLDWSENKFLDSMEHYGVVRSDTNALLGVVGKQWKPLQNSEAFQFFDPFISEGHATLESAGSLKEGRRVWVLAKIKNLEGDVLPGDTVQCYLLLSNGHDGKVGVSIMFTPIRVVCWNTLNYSMNSDKSLWHRVTLKHTNSLKGSLDIIQETLNLTKKTFEMTLQQYKLLTKYNVKDIDQYLISVMKPRLVSNLSSLSEEAKLDLLPKSHTDLLDLYENGPGTDNAKMRGTYWAAYNAITHWVDHNRGGSAENRLNSSWFNDGRLIKERALKEALKLAA